MAVMGLETLAMRKRESGWTGFLVTTSATPKPRV